MTSLLLLVLLWSCAFLEGCKSFQIQPKSWNYKGHIIAYEVSRAVYSNADETDEASYVPNDRDKEKEPILLLNGFGVGSFHQHRLIPRLLEGEDQSRVVYCVDYLGQGASWPRDCQDGSSKSEKGLIYSAETWIDQLIRFIEEVILPEHQMNGEKIKVHLVGNSVGGHLAAHLARIRPDLVASLCLLNPTPVWGLNLPGWSGHLPPPKIPKIIGRYLFDRIRDLDTIEKYLENAYANRKAFDKELVSIAWVVFIGDVYNYFWPIDTAVYVLQLEQMNQIRGCTLGNGGHAAFASILWSPPLQVSGTEKSNFQECLSRLKCDVLLVFGKDDPWCKPAFAKKMLNALNKREPEKVHRYVEIGRAGHCPNHEAPQAVARLVTSWASAKSHQPDKLTLVKGREVIHEPWGETIMQERMENDISLSLLDRLATTFV
jgi:pimeloyl-ACP methyl ester carboxylesterase